MKLLLLHSVDAGHFIDFHKTCKRLPADGKRFPFQRFFNIPFDENDFISSYLV
jgi:hypothetical protein